MRKIKNLKKFLILPILLIMIMIFSLFAFTGCVSGVRVGIQIESIKSFKIEQDGNFEIKKTLSTWLNKEHIKSQFLKKLITDKTNKFSRLVLEKLDESAPDKAKNYRNSKNYISKLEVFFWNPTLKSDSKEIEIQKIKEDIEKTATLILTKIQMNLNISNKENKELKSKIEIIVKNRKFNFSIKNKILDFKDYEFEISSAE